MRNVTILIVVAICIFSLPNVGMIVKADDVTKFYTYYELETRIISNHEYIETSTFGYKNFSILDGVNLPTKELSPLDGVKLLGVWLDEERLDSKYYFTSFENGIFKFEFDTQDRNQKEELMQKFIEKNDFEIIISVYIELKQDVFYKKDGKNIFFGNYGVHYDENDVYHKYSLVLPCPNNHNLRATAMMKMKIGEGNEERQPPLDIEIGNGDLILSWFITFPEKSKLFERITSKKTYFIYEVREDDYEGQKLMEYTLEAEYSYETLPLIQLLCALIISFPIGFSIQFFRDVKEGEYKKIEKIKAPKDKIIRTLRFFGVKNYRLKLEYTFFSFIIFGAMIMVLFAPDIFNTESIKIFHIDLSSLHLFSIESAKFIQLLSICILGIYIIPGIALVADFGKRKSFMNKISSKLQNPVSIFEAKIYEVIIVLIVALFGWANGLFPLGSSGMYFYLEFGLEIYITLGFIAYLKLYWVSIH